MGQEIEYKTPLVQIRGVFLCDNVADTAVSVFTIGITQEAWGENNETIGESINGIEDIWIEI
jgi:hypothetical protein